MMSPQAGLNHRPFAYEASALPLSYRGFDRLMKTRTYNTHLLKTPTTHKSCHHHCDTIARTHPLLASLTTTYYLFLYKSLQFLIPPLCTKTYVCCFSKSLDFYHAKTLALPIRIDRRQSTKDAVMWSSCVRALRCQHACEPMTVSIRCVWFGVILQCVICSCDCNDWMFWRCSCWGNSSVVERWIPVPAVGGSIPSSLTLCSSSRRLSLCSVARRWQLLQT